MLHSIFITLELIKSVLEPMHSVGTKEFPEEETRTEKLNSVRRHDEYLRYGGHLSQCTVDSNEMRLHDGDQILMWCGLKYSSDTYRKPITSSSHLRNDLSDEECRPSLAGLLNLSQPGDLVFSNQDMCRSLMEMMNGHSNDLFFLEMNDDVEQNDGKRGNVLLREISVKWVKTMACCSGTVPGMTRQMCQNVINWFIELANDVSLCRRICDVVLSKCGVFLSQTQDEEEEVTLTLQPLYTSIHDQLVQFEKQMAVIDVQLCTDRQSISFLSLYLETKPFKHLFSSLRTIALSVAIILRRLISTSNLPPSNRGSSTKQREG